MTECRETTLFHTSEHKHTQLYINMFLFHITGYRNHSWFNFINIDQFFKYFYFNTLYTIIQDGRHDHLYKIEHGYNTKVGI